MSLARLLPQIEARKQHLQHMLPDFNTASRYVWPQTFILNRERYLFEYYLLQVSRIEPQYFTESSQIEKITMDIRRILSRIYRVHSDIAEQDIPSMQMIEANLRKTAVRFFVDAAAANDMELLEVALQMGAAVNAQYCKESAIGVAVKNRHLQMVRHLLELGVDVNIIDGVVSQRTPLDYADENHDAEILNLLLTAGAQKRIGVVVEDEPDRVQNAAIFAQIAPQQDLHLAKVRENMMAFAGEMERMIAGLRSQCDGRMFASAAEKKANHLSGALVRAQQQFVTFQSLDEFVEYSEKGLPSIKTALGVSVKLFGRDKAQQDAEALIAKYRSPLTLSLSH